MEKSLFKVFAGIGRSYYGIVVHPDRLFTDNQTQFHCREFIDKHFSLGSKHAVLQIPYLEAYKDNGKHVHTVSLYLTGFSLKAVFTAQLKKKLGEFIPDICSWYDFWYTWFLTCMYHDTASCIEEKPDIELPNILDEFLRVRSITNIPEECKKVPLRFSKDIVAGYYLYRKKSKNLEHGITAGYFLFDKLVKNFKDKTQNAEWNNGVWYEPKTGLQWRCTHLDHYAYIADAIICHNIWLCTDKKDRAKYAEHGLDELIVYSEDDKLSFADYPLQFILCLLDTIEPTKRFYEPDVEPGTDDNALQPKDILDNISLIAINENTLRLEWTDVIKKHPKFYQWLNSIRSLQEWMRVEISQCKPGENGCGLDIRIVELPCANMEY